MTIEERRKALSIKIADYFNAKPLLSTEVLDETVTFSSKLNTMSEASLSDEDYTYQLRVEPKKNYYGTRGEVVKKEPRNRVLKRKETAVSNKLPSSNKIPYNEVTEILNKDRKHRLWDKEIYKWTNKDWEELYTLRNEK